MTATIPSEIHGARAEKFRARVKMRIRVKSLADKIRKMSAPERLAYVQGLLRGLRQ